MQLSQRLKQAYHRLAARLVVTVLRPGAAYLPDNFDLWQEHGYHIVPVHFYSPIPDTRDLNSSGLWTRVRDLPGIDWNVECQIEHLTNTFSSFGEEFFDEITSRYLRRFGFDLDNNAFTGVDPIVLYAFVRNYKPRVVLEIGSGHSTRVIAAALSRNGQGELISVDPYQSIQLRSDLLSFPHTAIQQRAEQLSFDLFDKLQAGDMLFIDSTHVVRSGGDVNFLLLEVLPRLCSGVIVHFHDIFLPQEYPQEWLLNKHIFWTEQYLLHAFLLFNTTFEILMANNYLAQRHSDLVKQSFPRAIWWGGGSFWMRRKQPGIESVT